MEAAHSSHVKVTTPAPPEEQLSQLFGSYKAEWLRGKLYELFTEPSYFPELTTSRPCILVGGRGTGKTTVLRCLSYEGQFALRDQNVRALREAPFFGFYYRANTNRVRAFRGAELPEEDWTPLFAHYFNLLICEQVLHFLAWYEVHASSRIELSPEACSRIATSLNLSGIENLQALTQGSASARIQFEAYVNNVADGQRPLLTMQGAPIDTLFEELSSYPPFSHKLFFILLDEYENFDDYQQCIVNSLIKHAGALYTFKVGVRELGFRVHATLNPQEQLISPADYVRINIPEKLQGETFREFARRVCNSRIARVQLGSGDALATSDIAHLLPGLTEDEEALRLGVQEHVGAIRSELAALEGTSRELQAFDALPPLKAYFLGKWAKVNGQSVREALQEMSLKPNIWDTRYSNYKHSLLYSINSHKRGIRRYYAGWPTFTQLVASNIRYVLELVEQSLLLHLRKGGALGDPISPEIQTEAAQWIGRKNLSELEGLTVYGARLTKLALGLGRVFQVMAEQPFGHAPEVNQFHLEPNDSSGTALREEAGEIVTAAVMHLALIRFSGSKLGAEGDTRDYDYMLHPIFSPFFVFSYRRKRRLFLSGADLVGLVRHPREAIRDILTRQNRIVSDELPEQLALFSTFYRGA